MVPFSRSCSILKPSNHQQGPRSVNLYFPLIFCFDSSIRPCELPIDRQSSTCTANVTNPPSAHFFTNTPWSVSVRTNPNCPSASLSDSYQLLAPCFNPYKALCSRKTYFFGSLAENSGGCSRYITSSSERTELR